MARLRVRALNPKSYHYKFNIPLIGILLFTFCIFGSFVLIRSYITGEYNVDPDPRTRAEIQNAMLAKHFPFGYLLMGVFMLGMSIWSMMVAWRSTLSLLGKDCVPLVFTDQSLTAKTIYGKSVSIAWRDMRRVTLGAQSAHFVSTDHNTRFSIKYTQIEGLDKQQIKKDVLRFHPEAAINE